MALTLDMDTADNCPAARSPFAQKSRALNIRDLTMGRGGDAEAEDLVGGFVCSISYIRLDKEIPLFYFSLHLVFNHSLKYEQLVYP